MATEIGKGTIPIEPDTTGFGTKLKAGVEGEAAAADFAGVGKKIGTAVATGIGVAVAAGAGLGVALADIGSQFDAAYDKIRVTTGATGTALQGLATDFKGVVTNVPASFDAASTAVGTLNQRLGLTGQPLQTMASQVLELSRITGTDLKTNLQSVTGTFNLWGIAVDQQPGKLDELFRASQATGTSVSDLATAMSQGGVQLKEVGLSFEQSASLLGLLGKAGLDVGQVFPALSRALATAAKEGKPAQQVFSDMFTAIKNAPTDTEAAKIAMDTLGARAGPKFAALIRQGKLSFDDLAKTIAAGGDTILKASADTMDWGEKLTLLKNKVFVALEPLALATFDGIAKGIEFATPYIAAFTEWLGKELPQAFAAVGTVVSSVWPTVRDVIVTSFTVIIEVGKRLYDALTATFSWFSTHKEALIGAAVGIGAVLVGLFTAWAVSAAAAAAATLAAAAPFIAIGAAIAAVAAGLVYAYNHWEWFRKAVDATVAWFRDVAWPALQVFFQGVIAIAGAVVGWFQTNWPTILAVTQTVWGGISAIVGAAIDTVRSIIETVVGGIQAFWQQFGDSITLVAQGVWTTIRTIIETTINVIRGIIQAVVALIQGDWQGAWDAIKGVAESIWNGIVGLVQGYIDTLRGVIEGTLLAIQGIWSSIWSGISSFLSGIWSTMTGIVSTAISNVVGFFAGFPARVASALASLAGTLLGIFTNAVGTVLGYIPGATQAIATLMGGLPSKIIGAIGDLGAKIWSGISGSISGLGSRILGAILGALSGLGSKIISIVTGLLPGPLKSLGRAIFGAEGGLITKPTLMVVGEAGPEVLLPLTKPKRSAQILQQAGLSTPARTPYVSAMNAAAFTPSAGNMSPHFDVRVYLGDKELRELVGVQVMESNRALVGAIAAGTR